MSAMKQTSNQAWDSGFAVECTDGYDWQYILSETGLTKSRSSELVRYFAKLPLDIQLDVLKA